MVRESGTVSKDCVAELDVVGTKFTDVGAT